MKVMTHKIFHLQPFMALLIAVILAACSTDNDDVSVGNRMPLTLTATIAGAPSLDATATRAVKYPTHDLWSNYAFATGDELGFFSKTGGGADGNQPLENVKLTAQSTMENGGAMFRAQDGTNIETGKLTADNVHFYFPYCEDITDTGLELRVVDNEDSEDNENNDGIKRCIDFLVDISVKADLLKEGELSGIIRHTFGELIITRGEGFEYWEKLPVEKQKITVVMKDPVTHVKINYEENQWKWEPKLVYSESAEENCDNKDARRWEAWKGDNYGKTDRNPDGKDAWYVIVPTLMGNPSVVEYIEIYDNEGNLQKITSLRLDNEDDSDIFDVNRKHQDRDGNSVWATWRYPMEIAMKELVPTVNPFPIIPWDQVHDITKERAPGITSPGDFDTWLGLYNYYIGNGRPEKSEEELKYYGDLEVDGDNEKIWHFYISKGFEFDNNKTIENLQDILDGTNSTIGDGYTFSNNALTNITNTFVNKLSGNGCLKNIDFKSPTVTVSDARTEAGILANTIEGGTITNCNINSGGLIGNANTMVGIIAGKINGGKVENCTLSGLVIGKGSDADDGYMFGEKDGDPTLTNNNSTNVTFLDINQKDDEP